MRQCDMAGLSSRAIHSGGPHSKLGKELFVSSTLLRTLVATLSSSSCCRLSANRELQVSSVSKCTVILPLRPRSKTHLYIEVKEQKSRSRNTQNFYVVTHHKTSHPLACCKKAKVNGGLLIVRVCLDLLKCQAVNRSTTLSHSSQKDLHHLPSTALGNVPLYPVPTNSLTGK